MQWIKSRNCDIIDDKEDSSPSALSQSWDIRQNGPRKIRVKHGAAILEDLLGPPIWRLLNSVISWNLLWLYLVDRFPEPTQKHLYKHFS